MSKNREDEFIHAGGRNLLLLCLGSVIIATITTAVSVWIYYSTGDIYLDRSRPGYIAEDEKHDEADDGKETFSSDGPIDEASMNEYKDQVKIIEERLNAAEKAFSTDPISDEALGIGEKPSEETN